MKQFKWSSCLSKGSAFDLLLKENEEDFVVRELGVSGGLSVGPLCNEETIAWLGQELEVELAKDGSRDLHQETVLTKIENLENKENRRVVHGVYSAYPYVYTVTVKEEEKVSVAVVYHRTHTKNVYSVNVTKKGRTTHEASEALSRELRVKNTSIKYAGNKDKRGITTQRLSISGVSFDELHAACQRINHPPVKADVPTVSTAPKTTETTENIPNTETIANPKTASFDRHNLSMEGAKIVPYQDIKEKLIEIEKRISETLTATETDEDYLKVVLNMKGEFYVSRITRIENGLKLGELSGNRFYLKLKTDAAPDVVADSIDKLAQQGFPNYYGSQRFGYGMNNPRIGECLLKREFQQAMSLILSSLKGLTNSPRVQEALKHLEEGDLQAAGSALPPKFGTEKTILRGMLKKIPPKHVFQMIRRENRMIYTHSYQSELFNDMLAERLTTGLAAKEYAASAWCGSITGKEEIKDLVSSTETPSFDTLLLPLFPTPEAIKPANSTTLPDASKIMSGGYRKAVVVPRDVSYSLSEGVLSLSFDLPPGTYATMVVKEVSKNGVEECTW
ncbi:tRNA pseudouridine13 synthase [Nematocida displodere]|uniref:tRNA pseudouridine13 synthase n=1 Tax=Nematocida displodere TaxID=1805483 RepID=A0A177EJN8_9MICR|nr:tRNA pseudouridine13 synthase [Nematocida displodere]